MRKSRVWVIFLAMALTWPDRSTAQGLLVWSDEFNGTSLDPANWEHMIGSGTAYGLPSGWGNNELQFYTDRPENSYVTGGFLHIVAREENYAGHSFTSARLRTMNRQDFLYGRVEARIKLPSTVGIWPAFWMLPTDSLYGGWASSGEIDIVESVNTARSVYGTIHFGGSWPNQTSAGSVFINGSYFSDGFYTYAIEWDPDAIRWYVDDTLYHTETSEDWYSLGAPDNDRAPFDQLFHLLLNVAVGGAWPGSPDESSVFPQEMLVDWVRVYDSVSGNQVPYPGQPHEIPGQIEAEDFDEGGESIAYHDCDSGNNGGAYRPADGVDIEPASEGGFNVGWLCADEWLEYTVDVQNSGAYLIEARVASHTTGGSFHLRFNGVDQTGPITVPATGGWQSWETATASADLDAGEQIMRFVNDGSSDQFNLNYFTVTALVPADIDRNGKVDLTDYELFYRCIAGPNETVPASFCTAQQFDRSDIDSDADVDLHDLRVFQSLFSP